MDSTSASSNPPALRLRVQVHEHLGVAVGLENRPFLDQAITNLVGIDDVAVVADGDLTMNAVDDDRLRIGQLAFAGGGISRVPDGHVTRQRCERLLVEDLVDIAHLADGANPCAVGRGNAGAFLSAVLEGVEAQVRELGRFGVPVDAENAAFFAEFVEHGCRSLPVSCPCAYPVILGSIAVAHVCLRVSIARHRLRCRHPPRANAIPSTCVRCSTPVTPASRAAASSGIERGRRLPNTTIRDADSPNSVAWTPNASGHRQRLRHRRRHRGPYRSHTPQA